MQKSPVFHYRCTIVLSAWATVFALALFGEASFALAVSAGSLAIKTTALSVASPQRNVAPNDLSAISSRAKSSSSLTAYAAGIHQLLAKPIPPKSNRILVGHALPAAIIHPALSALPEDHTAIFKVEPADRFHYITTLSPGQWQLIGKQSVADTFTVVQSPLPQVIAPVQTTTVPLIDAARELKGETLLTALRKGGFNLNSSVSPKQSSHESGRVRD